MLPGGIGRKCFCGCWELTEGKCGQRNLKVWQALPVDVGRAMLAGRVREVGWRAPRPGDGKRSLWDML